MEYYYCGILYLTYFLAEYLSIRGDVGRGALLA